MDVFEKGIGDKLYDSYCLSICEKASEEWSANHTDKAEQILLTTDITRMIYFYLYLIPLRIMTESIYQTTSLSSSATMCSDTKNNSSNRVQLTDASIHSLEETYPQLPLLMKHTCDSALAFADLLEYRLRVDHHAIEEKLCKGHKFQKVECLRADLSDIHESGRRVAALLLDNGYKIVYKPHSLRPAILYHKIFRKLSKRCGLHSKEIPLLDAGDYGWELWMEAEDCQTKEEIRRYYQRLGIHLFLAYAFSITDLHAENIIAAGEYPVILDLETFPGHARNGSKNLFLQDSEKKAQAMLANSVLQTGILPHGSGQAQGGIICTAIHPIDSQTTDVKLPNLAEERPGQLRIAYKNRSILIQGGLPRYSGQEFLYTDFGDDVEEGFCAAWEAWDAWRRDESESWLACMEEVFEGTSRVVRRSTQLYAMALNLSYHPTYMKSEEDRRALLREIWDSQGDTHSGLHAANTKEQAITERRLDQYEQDCLIHGFIPTFWENPKKKSILLGNGNEVDNYYTESAWDAFLERWKGEPENDEAKVVKANQRMLIQCACETVLKQSDCVNQGNVHNRELFPIILEIADGLCHRKITSGQEASWLGIERISDTHLLYRPLGTDLYDGLFGIALFFEKLLQVYDHPYYSETLRHVQANLFQKANMITCGGNVFSETEQYKRSGAFVGIGSMIHGFTLLYRISSNEIYLRMAEALLPCIEPLYQKDTSHDLIGGNAGLLYALSLLALVKAEKDKESAALLTPPQRTDLYTLMSKIGDCLWNSLSLQERECIEPPATSHKLLSFGIAHGLSGCILAFSTFYAFSHEEKHLTYATACMSWEDSLLSESKKKEERLQNTWCHGKPGMLHARMALYNALLKVKHYKDTSLLQTMDTLLSDILTERSPIKNCLCHGKCGNWLIAREYMFQTPAQGNRSEKETAACEGLRQEAIDSFESMKRHEYYHPGLMTGITGIGLSYLRMLEDFF